MSEIMPKLDKMSKIFEKYNETYDFKFCDLNEIEDVVSFIDTYWKKDHILVKSRKLMDWQHLDKKNNRYNFVIARHKSTKEIHSLLGFVTTQFFDPKIEKILLWGCIWKTRTDIKAFGLGTLLYYFLKINLDIETICLSGISKDGKSNYSSMGFITGNEDQFFFPNISILNYNISSDLSKFNKNNFHTNKENSLKRLSFDDYVKIDENSIFFKEKNPYKSKTYYINRYFNHPFYEYSFWGIYKNNKITSIFITREIKVAGSKCLRIIEYIGDYSFLQDIKGDISDLLVKCKYEYIDLIVTNIDSDILEKAGFYNRRMHENVIIPNYFEPFLRENVDIGYAYCSVKNNFDLVITKGDADQDRPNILEVL